MKPIDWEAKRQKDTQEVVTNITNWLNNTNHSQEMFFEMMDKEHRYLQGEFARLCANYLTHCAKDTYRYDGRNEHNVTLGKFLMYAYDHAREIQG